MLRCLIMTNSECVGQEPGVKIRAVLLTYSQSFFLKYTRSPVTTPTHNTQNMT